MNDNLLLMTDSYKAGHSRLYPPGMTNMWSYFEARGGEYRSTVFFGLQYYLDRYLSKPFTGLDLDKAAYFWNAHFGRDYFDAEAWERLRRKHDGYLPVRICAVPEGTIVPVGNVLFSVESTDEEFPWVPNFLETLLMKVWYPTTIATQSWHIRDSIWREYWTSVDPENRGGLDFACHDFGYRGVSSEETAAIGAAAHLLSFNGTDTVAGIRLLMEHYDLTVSPPMSGFSIPATEHSIICAFGEENEEAAFKHFLDTYPDGLIACVSDTYDIYNAVDNLWGGSLKSQVEGRAGRLVIRPDSGDPASVVLDVLDALGQKFGVTTNEYGYKVLNDKVRVIQGDGMGPDTIGPLYATIVDEGWSAENLVVGSGGKLLQSVTRDTCQFAFKAAEVTVDGEVRPIAKNPVTDDRKRSKKGRQKLVQLPDGGFTTQGLIDAPLFYDLVEDALEPVFENGQLLKFQTLDEIRARVRG